MSWANRGIPRRRDLSQIPVEARPVILSRAERPEVILSESLQYKPVNEIIYPFSSSTSHTHHSLFDLMTPAPLKRMEQVFPHAKELHHNDQSYVFVILRHLRNAQDNALWTASYQSIRTYYTNRIIIIDDNSQVNTFNGSLVNTEVIESEYRGAGEILPYFYFFQHKWADRMIILHDSMTLHRPFRPAELEGILRFHWHFSMKEMTYHVKMALQFSSMRHHEGLLAFLNGASQWKGCFGGAAMISYDAVEHLEKKYGFFSTLVLAIKTRKDREAFERMLGVVAFFEKMVEMETCSTFGDIIRYPGAFTDNMNKETTAHQVQQANYDTAILKVWRGR
jgi:hypothetical protein